MTGQQDATEYMMYVICMPHIRHNGAVNFLGCTDKMISFNQDLLLMVVVKPTLLGITLTY